MAHHCHDEHSHSHADGHVHDHSDDITPAIQHSLYQQIDFSAITTLNETPAHSGRAITQKTFAERLSDAPELSSDADEQLLMHIPFSAQVKLHSIMLRTSNSPSAPKTCKVFINRDDLDFSAASDLDPTQTIELAMTSEVQDVPVKRALFGSVRSLTLFFEDNFGDGDEDVTRVAYLGFKGEWSALGRAPQNILYESAARPSDHKVKGELGEGVGRGVGQ